MAVKHPKGLYELEFDMKRRVSTEKMSGFWHTEDLSCLQKDYENNLPRNFKSEGWAICSDLRDYKTSSISDEMGKHVQWKIDNGLKCSAIVVDSVIVKMQLNRAVGALEQQAFTSFDEANAWLKSKGF